MESNCEGMEIILGLFNANEHKISTPLLNIT
ncbi:hypothetical protein SAMN05518847_1018 [Paenibacillus sp. OV219]|nr:hypothetical protein SAMN05518847_1018 [Paenibacillus sp. OV219]